MIGNIMNKHQTDKQEILKRIYSLKRISYNLSVTLFQVLAVTEDNIAIDERTLRKHLDKCIEIVNEITNRYTQQLGELTLSEDCEELNIEAKEEEEVE